MAWTTPRTWVANEVVTAAIMNTHVRDNLTDLDSRLNAPDVESIDQEYADHATTGTTEETLDSFSLAAGELSTNGDALEIEAWGIFANDANAKTITIAFGSTDIDFAYSGANTLEKWRLSACIARTGAATQIMSAEFRVADATPAAVNHDAYNDAAPAETLSGAVTVAIKATTPSASGGATLKGWRTRKILAA